MLIQYLLKNGSSQVKRLKIQTSKQSSITAWNLVTIATDKSNDGDKINHILNIFRRQMVQIANGTTKECISNI